MPGLVDFLLCLLHIFKHLSDVPEYSSRINLVLFASISHDCLENLYNYDSNCLPDDTSAIRLPNVFTSAQMEVLITH